jgi:hypothetical protein
VDVVPFFQQAARQIGADEPTRAGDEYPPAQISASRE